MPSHETSVRAELERLADEAANAIGNAPGLRRIVEEAYAAGMARMREQIRMLCCDWDVPDNLLFAIDKWGAATGAEGE
jgi:hypothetical protein